MKALDRDLEFLFWCAERSLKGESELINNVVPRIIEAREGELTEIDLWNLITHCQAVCCFHDKAILDLLSGVGVKAHTLRWFISAEEISKELDRIVDLNEIKFSKLEFFVAILFHIENMMAVELIEDLGPMVNYNGKSNTNVLRTVYSRYFERKKYRSGKYKAKNLSPFDEQMDFILQDLEQMFGSSKEAKEVILKSVRGHTKHSLASLDRFSVQGITRSKGYLALFPLIKMIIKDESFLDEEGFDNQNYYTKGFNYYKIKQVKKYLRP